MQDKHGHIEYYQTETLYKPESILSIIASGLTDGDEVDLVYDIHGVKYYHFDDIIRARDATYNILGRFYMAYY